MHPAIGRLRGQNAPSDTFLDRLQSLNPRFRVSWLPPVADSPNTGCWGLYEAWGGDLWRASAESRMRLYAAHPGTVDGSLWFELEAQLDGQKLIGFYTDAQMGTEWMLAELRQEEERVAAHKEALELALRRKQRKDIDHAIEQDPAFAAYVREAAMDDYKYVCLGATSVVHPGLPQGATNG